MNSESKQLVRPTIYQFKFGEFIITNILEGHIARNDLHPFVATNATANDVEKIAQQNHIPYPELEHSFVCTVIETPKNLIVVDPGFGQNSPLPTAGYFMQSLNAAGYSAKQVDTVVISHSHPDHIGNLMTDGEATFENAEIIYGRTEFEFWHRGEHISEMRKPTLALFNKVAVPLMDRMRFVEPDETILPGLTPVNAFGHSAGHLAIHLESSGKQMMLLNDTIAHYVASFARPDWHFSMDDDPESAATSRIQVLDRVASEQLLVAGFHLPFPSLGYVESMGKGFHFHPATYQLNV